MPLNQTGKLSLVGRTAGESVTRELEDEDDDDNGPRVPNPMISEKNKLLTGKATGPWVFPDDWRGKNWYNELVTGQNIVEGNTAITVTIAGGVPSTAFSYSNFITGSGTLNSSGGYSLSVGSSGGVGSHTISFNFAKTSHVRNYTYNAYIESVSGPTTVGVGALFNVTLLGGAPNTTFTLGDGNSGTLDASGNYTFTGLSFNSAGTNNYTVTFNATGAGRLYYVTAYNESVSGPATIATGVAITISISGGVPNTGFSWSGATSGTGTLDGSGSYTFSGYSYSSAGTYNYTLSFNATGAVRTYSVVATAPPPPPSDGGGGGGGGGTVPGEDGAAAAAAAAAAADGAAAAAAADGAAAAAAADGAAAAGADGAGAGADGGGAGAGGDGGGGGG